MPSKLLALNILYLYMDKALEIKPYGTARASINK